MERTDRPRRVRTRVPSSRVSMIDFMTMIIDCQDCLVSMSWFMRNVLARDSLKLETICWIWVASSSASVSSSSEAASSEAEAASSSSSSSSSSLFLLLCAQSSSEFSSSSVPLLVSGFFRLKINENELVKVNFISSN